MSDPFQTWRDMLAGKKVVVGVDAPVPGYFKKRDGKGGPWKPVAIWWKDQPAGYPLLVARVAEQWVEPADVWSWCAENPIPKDVAEFAFKNGRFPDDPESAPRSNMPSDPFEAIKVEIEDKQAQADELLQKHPLIKSQDVCNLFRNLQAQILALNKRAEGMFDVEKKPLLEAARACDEKYRFRASAKVICERLRSRFETFMKAEEQRLKEAAEAKFRAERAAAEAERARIEAAQAKQMQDDPIAALTSDPPEMPELPLAPEPVKVNAGGGFGRKAGLRTEYVPQIEDYQQALLHFAEHPDVRAAVEKAVKQAVKASKGTAKIPGVRISEDRRAA